MDQSTSDVVAWRSFVDCVMRWLPTLSIETLAEIVSDLGADSGVLWGVLSGRSGLCP
jgi:hypothetical protein